MSLMERWREWRASRGEDEAVAEEMRFHIEQEAARNERHGMAPEEARRAAVRAFGGVDRYREVARDERPGSALSDLGSDVRYALRSLRLAPGFTAVAVLTLGLGIGANSGIFSVLNGVLLRPLPYPAPDALVRVYTSFPGMDLHKFWLSGPEFFELRERMQSFGAVGGYRTGMTSVGAETAPLRVTSATVTHGFFEAMAVPARIGRWFTDEELQAGAEPVMILSHELWQRAFNGDPAVVGSTVIVNGEAAQVTGVMPPGFDIADASVELWRPFGIDASAPGPRGNHLLDVVARLRPGVTLEQARSELAGVVAAWGEVNPEQHVPMPDNHPLALAPLREEMIGDVRGALLLLFGAVGFVLLIACSNVANLLLARSEARQREIAVRSALGAGAGRLVRQFLTEGVVLGLIGGALGVLLGYAGVRLLIATNPESIPRAAEIVLDARVLLFTGGVAVLTGLLFGLAPALHVARSPVSSVLREAGTRSTAGGARKRLRSLLVVSQLALAVMLMVGSALMLRSFAELQRVDPGFDPAGLLSFQLYLPPATYPGGETQVAFYDRLLPRLRSLPGVESVSAMTGMPPLRDVTAASTEFEGVEPREDGPGMIIDYFQIIYPYYLPTMRIPLVAGRVFELYDQSASGVVLINERLAQMYYPGVNPLGRRLRYAGPDGEWYTIVGVVGDVKQGGLSAEVGTEAYFFTPQLPQLEGFAPRTQNVVLRTSGDPGRLAADVQRVVRELDPTLPLANLAPMEEVVSRALARPRFLALLLSVFAAVALALAAVGTYGVMAYSVAQRRQEIGIRMALGARAGSVLGMVLAQGGAVAGIGLLLGCVGAFALSRTLSGLLFNVSATDPAAFIVAPLVLAAVALFACYLPARRATRVDPASVLKGA